jgi:hypothetical protein
VGVSRTVTPAISRPLPHCCPPQAERQEEARRENAAKTRDHAFTEAMAVIDASIRKAAQYAEKMSTLDTGDDKTLGITQQPGLMAGGTLRDYQFEGTCGRGARAAGRGEC